MTLQLDGGDEFLVNFEAVDHQRSPDIATLPDGRAIVAGHTEDSAQDGSEDAVKARIFDAEGNPVVAEFLVNTEATNHQEEPSLGVFADGRFVITWTTGDATQDGGSNAIKARLFNGDGIPVDPEFLVNTTGTTGDQEDPTIASGADGGFLVAWETTDTSQDGDGRAIKARLYDPDGVAVTGEFVINTESTASQQNSHVTALSDGRFS